MVENVKGNYIYVSELLTHCDIICLQEHWLYTYETGTIEELLPGYKAVARCCDEDDPVPRSYYRRGHAGVAIVWNKTIDKCIEPLAPKGNSRNLAIKIKCCHSTIFLITSYLPAGNSADEIMRYSETLDEVYELTQKYAMQGTVIWSGDLNGSLKANRHERDQLLQLYCSDVGYVPVAEVSTPTFYHNANSSTSRIDHILQLKSQERQVLEVCVRSREALNTSTHDPLIACINDKPSPNHSSTTMVIKAKKTMPHKINWEKVDVEKYAALIQVRVAAILDADITTPKCRYYRMHTGKIECHLVLDCSGVCPTTE